MPAAAAEGALPPSGVSSSPQLQPCGVVWSGVERCSGGTTVAALAHTAPHLSAQRPPPAPAAVAAACLFALACVPCCAAGGGDADAQRAVPGHRGPAAQAQVSEGRGGGGSLRCWVASGGWRGSTALRLAAAAAFPRPTQFTTTILRPHLTSSHPLHTFPAAATTSCRAATRRRGGARRCGAPPPGPRSWAAPASPTTPGSACSQTTCTGSAGRRSAWGPTTRPSDHHRILSRPAAAGDRRRSPMTIFRKPPWAAATCCLALYHVHALPSITSLPLPTHLPPLPARRWRRRPRLRPPLASCGSALVSRAQHCVTIVHRCPWILRVTPIQLFFCLAA